MFGAKGNNLAFYQNSSEQGTIHANVGKSEKRKAPDISTVTCYHCDKKGHYANECPNRNTAAQQDSVATPTTTGVQLLMAGMDMGEFDDEGCDNFVFLQPEKESTNKKGKLPMNWILLDNQSTINVFSNRKLLKNVKTTSRTMTIMCNAGVTHTNMIGEMEGYPGEVWYNPNGIANILSLSDVEKHYRVTYDSTQKKGFTVHKENGETRHFV